MEPRAQQCKRPERTTRRWPPECCWSAGRVAFCLVALMAVFGFGRPSLSAASRLIELLRQSAATLDGASAMSVRPEAGRVCSRLAASPTEPISWRRHLMIERRFNHSLRLPATRFRANYSLFSGDDSRNCVLVVLVVVVVDSRPTRSSQDAAISRLIGCRLSKWPGAPLRSSSSWQVWAGLGCVDGPDSLSLDF